MRKTFWILAFLLLVVHTAQAQTTTVTATVTDSDSVVWANFGYIITFQPLPGYSGAYTYQGAVFVPQQYSGNANGAGSISVPLPDNSFISPAGTKWQFVLQPFASGQSTQFTIPVTGTNLNLTSLFSSGVKPPRFAATGLTWGYSDVEVTPTPNPGGSYYSVTALCTRTWNTSIFQCNSGGGGGTPGGSAGQLQVNDPGNTNTFKGSPCLTTPSLSLGPVNINCNPTFSGLNPYVDPTNPTYGARALPNNANVQGLANTTTASPVITTTTVLALNNGDGVMIRGAGIFTNAGTPTSPTVVSGNTEVVDSPSPSVAPVTGASSYCYWGVARDFLGGLSLPGPSTCITTGVVLGHKAVTATSAVLTGNSLVITFSSTPADLAVGAMAHYQQSSNAQLSAMSNVVGVTGTTVTMTVANYCNPACSSTGGTLTYSNVNKLTFTLSANAYETYICGQRPGDPASGHFLGATMPNITGVVSALSTVFADYGATITSTTPGGFPSYANDAMCTAASTTNDMFSTTVVSGAGTTTLTLANNVPNGGTNQFITQDDSPAIALADSIAFNGGLSNTPAILDLPFTTVSRGVYNTWMPLTLSSRPRIRGTLFAHEPITIGAGLEGVTIGSTQGQFAIDGYSTIASLGAFPLLVKNGNAASVKNVQLSVSGNYVGLLVTGSNGITDKVGCYSAGNEYSGQCIVYGGTPFQETLSDFTATTGPNQIDNSSWVPTIYGYQSSNQNGVMYLKGALRFQPRGFFFDNTGSPFGMTIDASQMQFYGQGNIMPVIAEAGTNHPVLIIGCGISPRDTSIEPVTALWNLAGPVNSSLGMYACGLQNTGQETGGPPLPYSGSVQGTPNVNLFPALTGAVIPPSSMLAPGTTGKAANGQDWASVYSMVPSTNAPTSFAGVNFFDLAADNWPAFNINSSANKYFLATWLSTVSVTNGDCVDWVKSGSIVTLGDTGSACASSGGTPAPPSLSVQIDNSGSFGAVPVPTSPNNVFQVLGSAPVAGVGTTPIFTLAGVVPNAQTGTTYTIAAGDRTALVTFSNASPIAVTLPQAGTGGGTNNDFTHNFVFKACSIGAGTTTITPTTSTISYGTPGSYTAGASSMPLTKGQCAFIYSDNSNYFADYVSGNGVTSVSGDGSLITNVTSTGAVTLTLGNAGAHKYFGNDTGSPATGAYVSIVNADLPGAGSTTVNGTTCTLNSACTVQGTVLTIANASSTGTTLNTLTKLTGAPSTAVIAATTDTGGVVGICTTNCSTTGNATIAITGQVSCVFDGATTAGDYVQISSTVAGNCHDTGSGLYPIVGQVIGRVLSTNAASGTYTIDLFSSEIKPTSNTVATSNVTSVSSNQNVTLATAPGTGNYQVNYYASQNALTGGGACTVSFAFGWTDAGNARTLTTGSLTLGPSQSAANGFLTGIFPIEVASGNVTYTSAFNGSCGSATYDIHAALVKIQ